MKLLRFLPILTILAWQNTQAAIVEKPLEYSSGDVTSEGWQAFDDQAKGPRPGVLIIHQWTGVSEHEKEVAKKLAEMGYSVLVADIYGKGVRPQPPAAGQEAGKYKNHRDLFRNHLNAALQTLAKDSHTDAQNLAAIGYCFGGTGVLELARSGSKVKGIVSFHGGLDSPSPADGKNIQGKVLVLHGADDPYVPAKDIQAFEAEMHDAKVNYEMIKYPGAVHSFTVKAAGSDNSKGAAYNAEADHASWKAMSKFLHDVLGQ
jgi:dienelactone hydrolase